MAETDLELATMAANMNADTVREQQKEIQKAADEIRSLRQRIVSAEVALALFVAKSPRIDPLKMMQAYTLAYPEPMAGVRSVEMCVAAKESGELAARGGRVS